VNRVLLIVIVIVIGRYLASSIVTDSIFTGSSGRSPSTGCVAILSSTSNPDTSSPKHVYWRSRLLAWAPWPIRNERVLHAFVPFTTNGGATAWAGTTDGRVLPAYEWMGQHVEQGEIGFDRHFRALTSENIRKDPGRFARLVAGRAFIYLGPIRGRAPYLGFHRFAMLAALVALALGGWRARLVLPGLIWLGQGAVLVPIYLIDRYRFPTDWCVIVAAAIGIVGLAEKWGSRRAGLAAGIALLFCLAASLALAVR